MRNILILNNDKSKAHFCNMLEIGLKERFKVSKTNLYSFDLYEKDILLSCNLYFDAPWVDEFKKTILLYSTFCEVDRKCVDKLNLYDIIITPSEPSKSLLINSGVNSTIEVIPHFYEPDLYNKPMTRPFEHLIRNKIVFYHESNLDENSGIDLLIEGFARAFSTYNVNKQVALVIKNTSNDDTFYNKTMKEFKELSTVLDYEVDIHYENLKKYNTSIDLRFLIHRANIVVSLARRADFDLTLLRAVILNKPIICMENYNNGYMDYLSEVGTYFIPTMNIPFGEDICAIARMTDIIAYFKEVFNQYNENKYRMPSNNAEYDLNICNKFGYHAVIKQYKKLLENID
jgi:hypothetical protein